MGFTTNFLTANRLYAVKVIDGEVYIAHNQTFVRVLQLPLIDTATSIFMASRKGLIKVYGMLVTAEYDSSL